MDPVITRAVEDYDRLLKDEKELVEEMEDRLFERMRQAKLTFGGRVLCPFLRPNFVSPEVYEEVRGVCRGIMGAIEKAESRLGTALWDRVDLTPEERELMAIEPGYRRSSPTSPRSGRRHRAGRPRRSRRGTRRPTPSRKPRWPGTRLSAEIPCN